MDYSDVRKARSKAEQEVKMADAAVTDAARLIVGRLKSSCFDKHALSELKRELKNFNMSTWEWKE